MGFGVVHLAQVLVSRAAGVEVAQGGEAESVDLVHPVQEALDDVFRFAVGTARHDAFAGFDGDLLRVVEQVGGGGEDEAAHAVLHGAFDQVERVAHVVGEIQERFLHRFADERVRSEVHDAVGFVLGEGGVYHGAVFQVAEDEFGFRVDRGAVPLLEVVEDDHLVASPDQF